jgi:hypothetical protein
LVNIGCFDIGCISHIGVLVNIGCFDIGCISQHLFHVTFNNRYNNV